MEMVKQFLQRSERAQKEVWAMLTSLLFLLIGVLVILTLHEMNITGDTLIIALLLLPIVIWAVVSGRIKTFKAGDLEATFNEPVRNMMNLVGTSIANADTQAMIVAKAGLSSLPQIIEKLKTEVDEDQPIVMPMKLGSGIFYDLSAMQAYIDALSRFRNFRFLVFLKDEKVIAYMLSRVALRIFTQYPAPYENNFLNIVNNGQEELLKQLPGVITETAHHKDSVQTVLEKMVAQNLEALVVVDDKGQLKGVIDRAEVLSRMMLALATTNA